MTESCKMPRREQAYRPATVIITAFPLLAQEWSEAGADAFLHKPTRTTEILRVLEQLMFLRVQAFVTKPRFQAPGAIPEALMSWW
jgi:hypothetical protein